MSRVKERDELEALKLDEYFKETVEHVTPFVLALTVTEDRQLCRKWLEKLTCASSQRSLRNEYLCELCRFLRSGRIGGIFSKLPENGPLKPLQKCCNHEVTSSSRSELSDSSDSRAITYKSSRKSSGKERLRSISRVRSTDSLSSSNCACNIVQSTNLRFRDDDFRSERNELELCRKRIEDFATIVKEMRFENERLKHDLSEMKRNSESKENLDNLRLTNQRLTDEISVMKRKFVEVQNIKEQIEKNYQEIVEQYKEKNTEEIDELNLHLEETERKNVEFVEKLGKITREFEEKIREKEEEAKIMEIKLKETIENTRFHYETLVSEKDKKILLKDQLIHQKELEFVELNEKSKKEISLLNNKFQELDNKLCMKKDENDEKLQEFFKEEFFKMKKEMEEAAQKQSNELCNEVTALKRTTTKLEKSKEKLNTETEKKIFDLLKAKESEVKCLQLQIESQRSELMMNIGIDKQRELESFVGNLEDRYKQLLATMDENARNQRQQLLHKITVLENRMMRWKNNWVENEAFV